MPAVAVLHDFCELVVDKLRALVGSANLGLFVAPVNEGEFNFSWCVHFRFDREGKPRVRLATHTE